MSKKQILVAEYMEETKRIDVYHNALANAITETAQVILQKLIQTCESEDDESWVSDIVYGSRHQQLESNEKARAAARAAYQDTVEVWGAF